MLEMSNGYPNSASPLGSPSPGPSPGIGGHHNKRKILTILKLTNYGICFDVLLIAPKMGSGSIQELCDEILVSE